MPVPTQPKNLMPRPFAAEGTFQLIPDAPGAAGRASFQNGFPQETQLPLAMGGVAPNRTDFNGMFYMLSAFAFWQQSGGMFNYNAALNYAAPSVVYHNDLLWWCAAANGPEVAGVGVKTPGANGSEAYWTEFLQKLAGGSATSLGNPVGTVIQYYGTVAPEGYFACNGAAFSATTYPQLYALLGKATLPDMRGYFVRGYDTRNTIDPSGASRAVGSIQQDAMQKMEGSFRVQSPTAWAQQATGVFKHVSTTGGGWDKDYTAQSLFNFDSSRSVRTAIETRPKNICLLFCIKHD